MSIDYTFAPMIGFNRAGTTLLSSMLDAHPNILFSNEDESVRKILAMKDPNFEAIIGDMHQNVQLFNEKRRVWVNRSYRVNREYTYSDIKVYGDKKAGQTSNIFGRRPDAISRLCGLFPNLRPIMVLRNPLDVIAAVYNEKSCMINLVGAKEERTIDQVIEAHKMIVEGINRSCTSFPTIHVVYYEHFMQKPHKTLVDILDYLELDVPGDGYLDACCKLIKSNPLNRNSVRYTAGQLQEILRFTESRGLHVYFGEMSDFIDNAQFGVNPDSSRGTAV